MKGRTCLAETVCPFLETERLTGEGPFSFLSACPISGTAIEAPAHRTTGSVPLTFGDCTPYSGESGLG